MQTAERDHVDAAIDRVLDEAEAEGVEIAVAGDLQAQTQAAAEAFGSAMDEDDEWLEGQLALRDLRSMCGVEPTYAASGTGGSRVCSAIDHWLLSDGLARLSEGSVGPGVDGLLYGDEADGEGKGHNTVIVRMRLEMGGEGGLDGFGTRPKQLRELTELELDFYREAEADEARTALGKLSEDATGRMRYEAIEQAGYDLQRRIIEVADSANKAAAKPKQDELAKADAKVRRWQDMVRLVARAHPDDPLLRAADGGGRLGRAVEEERVVAALRAGAGEARRELLISALRACLADARVRQRRLAKQAGSEPDRVAAALLARLKEIKEGGKGGAAVWEIYRAVGRARADLVGKKTKPDTGTIGMQAIRTESGARVTEPVALLKELDRQAAKLHQEGGGSVRAVLDVCDAMEAQGVPVIAPRAVIDLRGTQEAAAAQSESKEALSDAALEAGRRKFRARQGVGGDGKSGYVIVGQASEETWREYKAAMRDIGRDVLAASEQLFSATSDEARQEAEQRVREAAPEAWTRWLVMLLTKPGKPADELSKRRDIYLQPHGLKLFMNGLKPEYDAVMRAAHQHAAAGFRVGRNAPECSLVLTLQREQAVAERRPWYRGYLDYSGFFQSCVRRVQRACERRTGVSVSTSDAVLALHAALVVSYDSGRALSPGTPSRVGNGQGDSDGPVRSMIPLSLVAKAVDWLVGGFSFSAVYGAQSRRIPSVWFCDDGAFLTDDFGTLQLCFLVVSAMSRALGLVIGVTKDGSKTAWCGAEWVSGEYRECGDETGVELIDGTKVPRVSVYPHLGSRAEVAIRHDATRDAVVRRCRGAAIIIARLGVLNAAQYVEAADVATSTVIAYYGAATPMGRAACESIDAAKRVGLAALGHRGQRTSAWLAHAPAGEGGYGMAYAYAHAAGALAAAIDHALRAEQGVPVRAAVAATIVRRYWELGWRPSMWAPRPLDWHPVHLLDSGALSEDNIIDAWLEQRLRAGVATQACGGQGANDALGDWDGGQTPGSDQGDRLLWEMEAGRVFKWRLARLGIVRLRHLHGGVDSNGEGRPRKSGEAGAVFGSGGSVRAGVRVGATFTAAEASEYADLVADLRPEELRWLRQQHEVASPRPAEPEVVAVHAARKGRKGQQQYLLEYSGGHVEWADRPKAGITAGLRQQCTAAVARADDRSLRERMQEAHGEGWLWLATAAPQALGLRDAAAIVQAAKAAGVCIPDGGEQEAAQAEEEAREANGEMRVAVERMEQAERAAKEVAEAEVGAKYGAEQGVAREARGYARAAARAELGAAWQVAAAAERQAVEAELRGEGVEELRESLREKADDEVARWVAVKASGSVVELMEEVQAYAQQFAEEAEAARQNSDGAGRRSEAVAQARPRRFTPSASQRVFLGTVERAEGEGGGGKQEKGERVPSLQPANAEEAARIQRLPPEMQTPKAEAGKRLDLPADWANASNMWRADGGELSAAEEERAKQNRLRAEERKRSAAVEAARAAAAVAQATAALNFNTLTIPTTTDLSSGDPPVGNEGHSAPAWAAVSTETAQGQVGELETQGSLRLLKSPCTRVRTSCQHVLFS